MGGLTGGLASWSPSRSTKRSPCSTSTVPRFIASLISDDGAEQERFYAAVDAPFVGDGFTRWVDGQYALDTPELGLSNWQFGRLLGRGGVLSGDSIHTVRHRATIDDAHDPPLTSPTEEPCRRAWPHAAARRSG